MVRFELADEAATQALGARLAEVLSVGDLVVLEGDLGAGKTTLVRACCRAAGVPEEVAVTSPTFTLVHELQGDVPILHADLYRLNDADEIVELGLLSARDRSVTFVEWGERFADDLGGATLSIRLALASDTARSVEIAAGSPRGEALLSRLEALPKP